MKDYVLEKEETGDNSSWRNSEAAWSCGGGTENFLHHNCKRKPDLFRPEELTQVTVDAVAELLNGSYAES